MLGQFDLTLKTILAEALNEIKGNPGLVGDIFDFPEHELSVIRSAFSAQIPVELGYPRDATVLPGVFVVLGALQEDVQTIGSGFGSEVEYHIAGDVTGDPLYWNDQEGTFVRSTVRLCCWTENANLTVWLQNVVLWALLRDRSHLNDAGYQEQRVAATDFEPLPRWFPTFVYRRDVTISAQHALTFTQKYRPIAEVQAEATSSGETFTARLSK